MAVMSQGDIDAIWGDRASAPLLWRYDSVRNIGFQNVSLLFKICVQRFLSSLKCTGYDCKHMNLIIVVKRNKWTNWGGSTRIEQHQGAQATVGLNSGGIGELVKSIFQRVTGAQTWLKSFPEGMRRGIRPWPILRVALGGGEDDNWGITYWKCRKRSDVL